MSAVYIVKPAVDPIRRFASLVAATRYALSVGAIVELL